MIWDTLEEVDEILQLFFGYTYSSIILFLVVVGISNHIEQFFCFQRRSIIYFEIIFNLVIDSVEQFIGHIAWNGLFILILSILLIWIDKSRSISNFLDVV
jgi:hypothetical protein